MKAHQCMAPTHSPHDGYGVAVESCYTDGNGVLWVRNGEYGSPVRYCPYCGIQGAEIPEDSGYKPRRERVEG